MAEETTAANPPVAIPSGMVTAEDKDARTWGMLAHLSSYSGWLTGIGYIAGPLIVWLIKKDQYSFVDKQGKEAMNFNLSLAIYLVASILLAFTIVGLLIAIPAWIAIAVGHLVFTLVAGIKANEGEVFRYPLTIRLIK